MFWQVHWLTLTVDHGREIAWLQQSTAVTADKGIPFRFCTNKVGSKLQCFTPKGLHFTPELRRLRPNGLGFR
jgi:hypothetical protein